MISRRATSRLFLLGCGLILGFGCLHTPIGWSPDGRWVAYCIDSTWQDEALRPGWIFQAGATEPPTVQDAATGPYRLWVSRADNGASILIEQSNRAISSPGWSPDGRSLAFVRVVEPEAAGGQGPARLEVILHEGLHRRKVLTSRPIKDIPPELDRLPGQAVVWSPDARHLAVPQVEPAGVAIIRSHDGRTIRFLDEAMLPSWSGDGGKLGYFVRGESDSLWVTELHGGAPRMLLDVGQAGQAPVWTRDGTGLLTMVHKSGREGGPSQTTRLDLVRVQVESGMVESIRTLTHESNPNRLKRVEGTSFAIDRDGENLFHTVAVEGQARQISWYQVRNGVPYKNFAPIDMNLTMGSLSVSPGGSHLAFRVGEPEHRLPPILLDIDPDMTATFLSPTFLVPDDAARMAWVNLLASHASRLLRTNWVLNDRAGGSRPVLLPVRGEFADNSELSLRLRRLGRLGRMLCDRPEGSPPLSTERARVLDEARLFFDILREDFEAAERSVARLSEVVQTRKERRDLLSIGVLIALGRGETEAAERTISYLRETSPALIGRVEQTAGRSILIREAGGERPWLDYLVLRTNGLKDQLKAEADAVAEPPLGHRNPDAPQPGLGLDAIDARLELPFRDLAPRPGNAPFPPPGVVLPPPPGRP